MTASSMVSKTPSPAENALTLTSAAPSTTSSRRSWPQVIAKDGEIQRINIETSLKNKRIERLETYIDEMKKKFHTEQKLKAKFEAQLDRFMGVVPVSNNQPQVAVNQK
jgi:hypothetical protein